MLDDVQLTSGVEQRGGVFVFPGIEKTVPVDTIDTRDELLRYGFASETPNSRFGVLFASKARILPYGVLKATAVSITHNVRSMFLLLCLAVAGLAVGILGSIEFFTTLAIGALLLGLSIIVHEAGHVAAFRLVSRSRPGIAVAKNWNCTLVRPALATPHEIFVVCAGPLAPLLFTLLLAPVVFVMPLLWFAQLAIGVGHLVSLVVPVGDGANLYMLLAGRMDSGRKAR